MREKVAATTMQAEVISLQEKREARQKEASAFLEKSLYLLSYMGAMEEKQTVRLLAELKVIRGEWPPRGMR